jgi:hypothetical protein
MYQTFWTAKVLAKGLAKVNNLVTYSLTLAFISMADPFQI